MRDSSLDKMYKNTNAENMLETAFFFFLKPCFFSKSFLFSYILMPEVQEIFFAIVLVVVLLVQSLKLSISVTLFFFSGHVKVL